MIWGKLVEATPKFGARRFNDSDRIFTEGVFQVFKSLGENLSYTVRPKKPKKGEFLRIDQVWMEGETVVLAMESENSPTQLPDPIDDEWRKLVNVKANMKVLVTYCSEAEKRQKWVERAGKTVVENEHKLSETYFLILGASPTFRMNDPYIQYFGWVFDSEGKIKEFKNSVKIDLRGGS